MLENSIVSTHAGTIAYWPPEQFSEHITKYDTRADVWSIGITLLEVILAKLPYKLAKIHTPPGPSSVWDCEQVDMNETFLPQLIMNTCLATIIKNFIKFQGYSSELCDLLEKCTEKFENRAKFEELMETQLYHQYKKLKNEDFAQLIAKYVKAKKSEATKSFVLHLT